MTENQNAKQFPKTFYCRHMLPGVVRYENFDAETGETVEEHLLIDTDTMKRNAPSLVGKPIFVGHQKVDLANLETQTEGWVTECFYNELDGWLWAKCLAVSDEAQRAIANGWSVSNAYVPEVWDGAGQHLNLDYQRKMRDYSFTHLAIVPNPRYEEAKIFTPDEFKEYNAKKRSELDELQNSKTELKQEPAMKFFRTKQEEVKAGDILDTDFVEIKNSDGTVETVTVAALKAAKLEEKTNTKKNEKLVDDEEEIEVDGEKVNMGDLKKCYSNMKAAKKNSEDEAAKKAEDEKANAEEEEKKKEEEEKTNAKNFQELQNAHLKGKAAPTQKIDTQFDKLKRGKERY